MRDPILITGCARSGTSLTAGVVAACGAFGGDMFINSTLSNPKGNFENRIIREGLTKPFLRLIGADPMGQYPLPDIARVREYAAEAVNVRRWREVVQCTMSAQGAPPHVPWFYKGAKMCLFWPLWFEAFPEAQWVIVRRSDTAIVKSCMRTPFMKAHKTQEGWQSWVSTHIVRFKEMKRQDGLRFREVWPEKLLAGFDDGYKEMMTWLELLWNEEAVQNFIDPALWERKRYR